MPFSIPITNLIDEIKINEGIFIFLHRASKIPPHIGLIVNGKLFEIATNGPGYNLSGLDMLKTAQKRGVEVLFVELINTNRNAEELEQLICSLVKYYNKVSSETSCISPIKDFIHQVFEIDVNFANFIFELLPILYSKKVVKASYEVNLTNRLIANNFLLKKYTKQDIEDCITAVNRKNNIEISIG